jgi:FkbH-like protein
MNSQASAGSRTDSGPPRNGAWDELARRQRAGTIAAEYPAVRGLLASLPDEQLRRAGHLLSRVPAQQVLDAHPDTPQVTVAITGHGTLNPLIAPLTAEFARHGLLLRPLLSDFDSYVFDLADPDSALYAARPDLALCVLDPQVVFDEVPVPWRPDDVAQAFAERLRVLQHLADRFNSAGHGVLVLNTVPLPRQLAVQLVDQRSRAELGALWREANARLLRLSGDYPGVVVIDTDTLVSDGIPVAEPRLSVYAKAHLSPGLLAAYANQVAHLARQVTGRTKKVLAVDLDGTVWGGVLGEDGADGVVVADGYRGEAFTAFQKTIKQFAAQGVLLAAVSKNDLEPVRQVLRDHPDMVLSEGDFVRIAANWRPKHENLLELAADLNLATDSIVFVDDSPYEAGLVRREMPEVAVIQVDSDPALHIRKLVADGWFDTMAITADDHQRPARYREELARKDFLSSFDSVEQYLRELAVSVRVSAAAGPELGRVSQLTLRTNQFNLTTRRLQLADVTKLAGDEKVLVLSVHAADRFGENGIVGTVIARRDGDVLHIDDFVLSCRVFSRGIEQSALAVLLRHARSTGASSVAATYRRTPKNGTVRDFYPRHGFAVVSDDGQTATFRHDLSTIVPPPAHVRLTEELERTTTA